MINPSKPKETNEENNNPRGSLVAPSPISKINYAHSAQKMKSKERGF